MKNVFGVFAVALTAACGPDSVDVLGEDASQDVKNDVKLDAPHDVVIDRNLDAGISDVDFNLWPPAVGPIVRHEGPVMLGTPSVYTIWYGDWSASKAQSITAEFFQGLSGSDWLMINSGYWQLIELKDAYATMVPAFVSGMIKPAQSINVGYPLGPNLGQNGVRQTLIDVLTNNMLPTDDNAAYFVLTSADVREGSFGGFCDGYCGWHDHQLVNGKDIKFSFVGDASSQCADSCIMQPKYAEANVDHSPNNDWGADGMVSVIAHELSEMLTDPDVNAWYDAFMNENADMCAWRFTPVYQTPNGSLANVRLGQHDYLIQQNWVLDGDAGHCDLHK